MRKLLASVAFAAALALPGMVRAEVEVDIDTVDDPAVGELTLSAGADLVTAYVFRGYEYQDSGLIVQPYAQVGIVAAKTEDLTITPYVGDWNSIQEEGAPGDGHWYESDLYAGVDFAFEHVTVGAIYTWYTAPENAFETIEEFGLKLTYDDSREAEGMGAPFQFNPYIAWYIETSDENEGGSLDQYVELGINPTVAIEDTPFSLSFPVAIGLSADSYFVDDNGHNTRFGFASAGAYVSYAIPVSYGEWSIYGGATYYYLNADSVQTYDPAVTGDGEDRNHEIVGKVGLLFSI